MKKLICLLTIVSSITFAAVVCKSQKPDPTHIKVGTPRTKVIEMLGEPQATLSGLYGDIYWTSDANVIITYDVRTNSDAMVKEVKVLPQNALIEKEPS